MSDYLLYFFLMIGEEILGFSTTKNSSQEIIEGIFGEEIWEVFLVIRAFFFINRGRDFWIFHHQIFPKVIEGIFGEEFGPPENPRFNETLKFFPPILGVIRTNIYPCGRIVFHSLKHMAQKISYADSKCNQKLSEN